MGMTNATMRRGTPNSVMRCMASGSAASEEVVVKAMIAGSLTARTKRRSGIRASHAAGTRATSANTMRAPYSVATRRPRFLSTWIPLWLTVTAMAAPMPIGANRMTIPTNLNITSASPSANPSIASLGRPRTWVSAIAKSAAQNTTWSTSLSAAASKKLLGTICSRNPPKVVGAGVGMAALGSGAGRITPTPGRVRLTAMRPMASATVVISQK